MAGPDTLFHDRVDSPIGPLAVGLTARGLAMVVFGPDALAPDDVLRAEFPRLEPARGKADEVRRQLDAYFAGAAQTFALPLDLRGTPFQREVWAALQALPYGQTRSYLEVARLTGRKGGARAVGQAVRRNPVPIVVPCHRVIAADGGLGGYGGRWSEAGALADIKRYLLQLERRAV